MANNSTIKINKSMLWNIIGACNSKYNTATGLPQTLFNKKKKKKKFFFLILIKLKKKKKKVF